MGENSGIGWTDHTFNGWIGCTEAGPGCDLCYARSLDARYQWGVPAAERRTDGLAPHWGIGAPRYRTAPANWRKPLLWNRDAEARGVPYKVFAHSLSDVFDKEAPQEWREDLFAIWRATPWLRWIVVTKRAPLIKRMLPKDWGAGYPNVGLVATVCDQDELDRDWNRLLEVPAAWHGFSIEPQIGPIVLPFDAIQNHRKSLWFITGGESRQAGNDAPEPRPYNVMWAYSLIQTAKMLPNAYVFVKQTGAKPFGGAETIAPPRDGSGTDPLDWPGWMRKQTFVPELLA